MSRYGGFSVGKAGILNNWENRKSSSSGISTPLTVLNFDYSTAKGIWNLRSTTQFPKRYVDNVSLLLHADGTNGSTVFTDSSTNSFTVTSVSSAAISTSAPKFGTGSISLNGTSQYLTVPDSSAFDFGNRNWTVECWVYVTSLTTDRAVIFKRVNNLSDRQWIGMSILTTGNVLCGVSSSSGTWGVDASSTSTVSLNTWTHLALVRNSSDISLYVNGIKNTLSTTVNFSVFKGTSPVLIGLAGTTGSYPYYFSGKIDEVRITKDIAQYTSSFTPATAAFPNP